SRWTQRGWWLADLGALGGSQVPVAVLQDEDVGVAAAEVEGRFAGAKTHFGAADDDGCVGGIKAHVALDGLDRLELDLTGTDGREKHGLGDFGTRQKIDHQKIVRKNRI